jgi:hypothetical protein
MPALSFSFARNKDAPYFGIIEAVVCASMIPANKAHARLAHRGQRIALAHDYPAIAWRAATQLKISPFTESWALRCVPSVAP